MLLGYLTLSPNPLFEQWKKLSCGEVKTYEDFLAYGPAYGDTCRACWWNQAVAATIRDIYLWMGTETLVNFRETMLDQVAMNNFDMDVHLRGYDSYGCSPYYKPYESPCCEHDWTEAPSHKSCHGDDIYGMFCEKCGEMGWLFEGKTTTKKEGYAKVPRVVG